MNPLTNVKNITKLNEIELAKGTKKSWHDIYKESAWIFIGGLAYGLTEGDIIAVFSQYGEIVNINMVRDKKTGKTKGFCFICYANQKSTVLAVDNLNGIKLCNRTIRVDHVANYKPPKEDEKDDEITKMLKAEGCAPKLIHPCSKNIADNLKVEKKKKKKLKKEKKKHKKKKKRNHSDESATEIDTLMIKKVKVKQERHDPGYDKYETSREDRTSDKEQFGERLIQVFKSEPSSSQAEYRLDIDKHLHKEKTRMKDNIGHRSISANREKSRDYDKLDSVRYTDHSRINDKQIMDKQNRSRSTSNESSNSSSAGSDRHKKGRKSKTRLKLSSHKYNSSSDSSSDDESDRDKGKMTKNEKFRNNEEKHSSDRKSRAKYDKKIDNSDNGGSSRFKKNYDRRESYSAHKSQNKH